MSKPKIALVMCPSWSINTPPLGLSIISAYLKKNEYEVKCFDLNIESYKNTDSKWLWDSEMYYMWDKYEDFEEKTLPTIKETIDNELHTKWEAYDIIGFTVFSSNLYFSIYLADNIKRIFPEKKIVFGGRHFNLHLNKIESSSSYMDNALFKSVDRIVIGEGENELLEIAREYEQNGLEGKKIIISKNDVDLNKLPVPDITDFNFKDYRQFAIQMSRGCISKCTFCVEHSFSHFKFRKAENVFKEILQRVEEWDVLDSSPDFHIIDSSVNSNLNEIIKLSKMIIENNIDLIWTGYMRVHPGMTDEVMKLLNQAGACTFSYGIETGSQKVADAMNKRMDLKVSEKNLEYGAKNNIINNLNWMVGFPTETSYEYLESLLYLHNNRENIHSISPGFTCGIIEKTPLDIERDKYNIPNDILFYEWYTRDFNNTKLHRYMRLRIVMIWMSMLKLERVFLNTDEGWSCDSEIRYKGRMELPPFVFKRKMSLEESLIICYVKFLWLLKERLERPFKFEIHISKDSSVRMFGDRFNLDYSSDLIFSVDENNCYEFRLDHELNEEIEFVNKLSSNGVIKDDSLQWFVDRIMEWT